MIEQILIVSASCMFFILLALIEEKMTDIELCYIDDPDNCADDDERWIILKELKSKIIGENK